MLVLSHLSSADLKLGARWRHTKSPRVESLPKKPRRGLRASISQPLRTAEFAQSWQRQRIEGRPAAEVECRAVIMQREGHLGAVLRHPLGSGIDQPKQSP